MGNRAAALLALGCILLGACDEGTTVGPEGGVVISHDGQVVLDIPAGALQSDVQIDVERVDDGPSDALGATYAVEPTGLLLDRPATLSMTIPSSPGGSADFVRANPSDLAVVTRKGDQWEELADQDLDEPTGSLEASVLFFSTYTVMPTR